MASKPVLTLPQKSAFNNALQTGIQQKDMDVIKLALANGAEPNLLMFAGIEYKASWKDGFNDAAGNKGFAYEWVKTAVEAGADVQAAKRGGGDKDWPAMHWAAYNFNRDVIDFLTAQGASIDTPSPFGSTPLMMAVDEGKADRVRYYLEKGADPLAPCGEKKDTFPLKALEESDKFTKGAKKALLLLMMQKAKAHAEEAAAPPKPSVPAPAESADATTQAIEVLHPLALKVPPKPEAPAKTFSL